MYGNERHDEAVFSPQADNYRRHQGRDHNIVGCGGQSHPQDQADNRREDQNQHQIPAGDELDKFGHHQSDPRQGDRADHDTGRRRGHPDSDHVFGAGHHAFYQIVKTSLKGERITPRFSEKTL